MKCEGAMKKRSSAINYRNNPGSHSPPRTAYLLPGQGRAGLGGCFDENNTWKLAVTGASGPGGTSSPAGTHRRRGSPNDAGSSGGRWMKRFAIRPWRTSISQGPDLTPPLIKRWSPFRKRTREKIKSWPAELNICSKADVLPVRVFKVCAKTWIKLYSPANGSNISETYPDGGYILTMSSGVMRTNKEAVRSAIARNPDDLSPREISPRKNWIMAAIPFLIIPWTAPSADSYWTSCCKDSQAKPGRLNQQRESIPDVKPITVEEVQPTPKTSSARRASQSEHSDHPAAEAPLYSTEKKRAGQLPTLPRRCLTAAFCRFSATVVGL